MLQEATFVTDFKRKAVLIAAFLFTISSSSEMKYRQEEVETEMSCDTYPYGVDASPMVMTHSGKHPTIDSITWFGMYGHIGKTLYFWNKEGKCLCNDKRMNLKYSPLFFHHPEKSIP